MIAHTIDGLSLPQTRTYAEVLADMETMTRTILSRGKPPSVEALIVAGRLRYAYEPKGYDEYMGWWSWPVVPAPLWQQHQELLWTRAGRQSIVARGLPEHGLVAIDDCDGFATHGAAWHRSRGRRAWPVVQEFKDAQERLRGWHALLALELSGTQRHVAEIPWPPDAYALDTPWRFMPAPGARLVMVDLAWMAGMPRRQEGRFPMDRLALSRLSTG